MTIKIVLLIIACWAVCRLVAEAIIRMEVRQYEKFDRELREMRGGRDERTRSWFD
jgi:hypothetical protein